MPVEVYEEYKGESRDSKQFCVPRFVREELLMEHAGISRREMASTIRAVGKVKSNRRKTVVKLGTAKKEERIEKAKTMIRGIIKPSTSYERLEAKMWDDAHAIAVEKAQRLEESIHRGESVGTRDLYRVGMPTVQLLQSRRNTVSAEAYGSGGARERFGESKVEEITTQLPPFKDDESHRRRLALALQAHRAVKCPDSSDHDTEPHPHLLRSQWTRRQEKQQRRRVSFLNVSQMKVVPDIATEEAMPDLYYTNAKFKESSTAIAERSWPSEQVGWLQHHF